MEKSKDNGKNSVKFKQLMNKKSLTAGITLIALVITIIVLLILAGVSIATLTGENGIITQAMNAKERTEIEEHKEQIKLAYISLVGKVDFEEITPVNLQKEIEDTGYENIVTQEKDENGKKGLLVNLTKKDRYYFIENDGVREATKEEFSKEVTPMYAILYSDGDLRFNTTGNIDETKTANGVTVVIKSEDISNTRLSYSGNNMPWASKKADIKTVTIEEKIVLKYGTAIFAGLTNLEKINGIEKIFTDNVPEMSNMFINCSKLTELDLSGFNTSNVTTFLSMFENCSSLIKLDLSDFNTSKIKRLDAMFNNCSNLVELDLSSFDVSNVEKMPNMFFNCSNLIKLDLSGFKTSNKLTSISEIFSGCKKITELDLSGFDTSNVTLMVGTFRYCENLRKLKLSDKFVCTNVTNMNWMFNGCISLTELDLSSFKETKVSSMMGMFDHMINLKKIDISNLETKNVTNMSRIFYQCRSLESLDMRSATFNKVTTFDNAFNLENTQLDGKIIVKDDETKAWVQNKLAYAGTTTAVTPLEL